MPRISLAPNPPHNLRAVDKMARVWQPPCCSAAICITLQILMLLCSHVTAQDSCVVSPWEDVINRDLSVFKTTTLHPGLIEEGKRQCYGGWEVMIFENQLYAIPFGKVPRSTRPPALDLLAKALCRYKFPNVRFILNAYERKRYADTRDAAVVFSSSKDPNSDVDILLPHHSFVYMPSMRNDLAGSLPFEHRMDQAIWRGAATGGPYNNFTWRHTTRSRAVAACQERQDICDAGFTGFDPMHVDPTAKAQLLSAFGRKEPMSMVTMASYKYIVALDGQAAPTGTVARALFSGSLLLRQESPWQEFFYTGLRPYEHYVPISYSAGDIVQQIEWARANPDKASQIARQARQYAERHFTDSALSCHVYRLFSKYAEMQTPAMKRDWQLNFQVPYTASEMDSLKAAIDGGRCEHFHPPQTTAPPSR